MPPARGKNQRVLPWPCVAKKLSLCPDLLYSKNILTVREFLTVEECEGFIKAAEARGLEHQGSLGPAKGEAFRDNERLAVRDCVLADQLWNAGLKPLFKSIMVGGKPAMGLNPNFRFYRYGEGQRFGPHYDERIDLGGGHHTEYTLLVYLTGGIRPKVSSSSRAVLTSTKPLLVGGETVFYSDRKRVVAQVAPIAGMALVHIHGDSCLLHEAKAVLKGVKYVLRSDVVFA